MDLKALTSKKVAGIPVLYIVLVVAAVGLYGAFRLKPSPPEVEPTETEPDAGPVVSGDAGDTSQPVFQATPTITQPSGVNVGSVTATAGPDSDTLWQRRAIEYLISPAGGGYSLAVATSAVSKYLESEPLTSVEGGARDKAVTQFGIPPESVPNSSVDLPVTPIYSGPAAKQGIPPTTHTVKGTSDDSQTELLNLYYGGHLSSMFYLLRAYNPGLSQGVIPVGTKVVIPKLVTPKYYVATSATRDQYTIAQKNATTPGFIAALNPNLKFPVAVGTRVRVV